MFIFNNRRSNHVPNICHDTGQAGTSPSCVVWCSELLTFLCVLSNRVFQGEDTLPESQNYFGRSPQHVLYKLLLIFVCGICSSHVRDPLIFKRNLITIDRPNHKFLCIPLVISSNRELKRVYRNGCRYNERLNAEAGGSKTPRIY